MPHLYERVHTSRGRTRTPPLWSALKRASIMPGALENVIIARLGVVLVPHLYERIHLRGADPNATPVERPGASIMEALWKTYNCSGRSCFGATSV